MQRRDEERTATDHDDEGSRQQNDLTTRLDRYLHTIDEFKRTIDKQMLKKNIEIYEKNMKDFDQQYIKGDKQILAQLGQNKRHDEHLSEKEMETLFAQELRGHFSKAIRSYEN